MSYVVAYIDEKKDERDNFYSRFHESAENLKIELIDPASMNDLEQMITHLLNLDLDAVISDFNLSEYTPLSYSGSDLLDRFRLHRPEFPCFLWTAYEDDAIRASTDVNMVYPKSYPKFERVILQIKQYRLKLENWDKELLVLLDIPKEQRTAQQNDKIIELDHCLENAMDRKSTIPRSLKRDILNGSRYDELLEETNQLIKNLRKKLDDT